MVSTFASILGSEWVREGFFFVLGLLATIFFTRSTIDRSTPSNNATVIGSGTASVMNNKARRTNVQINLTIGRPSGGARSNASSTDDWEIEWWMPLAVGAVVIVGAAWLRIEFDQWLRPLLALTAGVIGAATATVCWAGMRENATGRATAWINSVALTICAFAPLVALIALSRPFLDHVTGDYALALLEVNRHEGILDIGGDPLRFLASQIFGVVGSIAVAAIALAFALRTDWRATRSLQLAAPAILLFMAGISIWTIAGGPSQYSDHDPRVKAAGEAANAEFVAAAVTNHEGEIILKWRTPKRNGSVTKKIEPGLFSKSIRIRPDECEGGCSVRATLKTAGGTITDTVRFR